MAGRGYGERHGAVRTLHSAVAVGRSAGTHTSLHRAIAVSMASKHAPRCSKRDGADRSAAFHCARYSRPAILPRRCRSPVGQGSHRRVHWQCHCRRPQPAEGRVIAARAPRTLASSQNTARVPVH